MNNNIIIRQILSKIINKTTKNEIEWKESLESNCYEFSTSNMTVKMEKIFSNDPFETVIFYFMDNRGDVFERADALDYFSSFEELNRFFEKVEKQVNKTDEKLNTLLNELDDISPSM